MKNLIIIGAGGFGREVYGYANECDSNQTGWTVKGFIDDNLDALASYDDITHPVLGKVDDYSPKADDVFVCAIGQPNIRQKIVDSIQSRGGTFTNVIHPKATIGSRVKVGTGCIITPGVTLMDHVTLGDHVALNIHTVIRGGAHLGDFVQSSCLNHVGQDSTLHRGVFMGSRASVLENLDIGEWATVGAGAVIAQDVKPGSTMAGPVARVLPNKVPVETSPAKKDEYEIAAPSVTRSPQGPSMLLLGKKDDPLCAKALAYVRERFGRVDHLFGTWGDPFPKELYEWDGDYVVSYLSRWVLKQNMLDRAHIAAINFHPAPPEYPGIGCNNFALYNNADTYGVTCHHMHARVDTGPLIRVDRFPVLPEYGVAEVLEKTYEVLYEQFTEIMDMIIAGDELPQLSETWTRAPYSRKEFEKLFIIEPDMDEDEVARRIRAIKFRHWRPYMLLHGQRFELKG